MPTRAHLLTHTLCPLSRALSPHPMKHARSVASRNVQLTVRVGGYKQPMFVTVDKLIKYTIYAMILGYMVLVQPQWTWWMMQKAALGLQHTLTLAQIAMASLAG